MAAVVMSASIEPPTKPTASARCSPQIIEDRYIDDDKLLEICKEKFGLGNYQLKYKLNRWYLQAPCWLDEETLELCEIQYL